MELRLDKSASNSPGPCIMVFLTFAGANNNRSVRGSASLRALCERVLKESHPRVDIIMITRTAGFRIAVTTMYETVAGVTKVISSLLAIRVADTQTAIQSVLRDHRFYLAHGLLRTYVPGESHVSVHWFPLVEMPPVVVSCVLCTM
jgi:hypothetical protein